METAAGWVAQTHGLSRKPFGRLRLASTLSLFVRRSLTTIASCTLASLPFAVFAEVNTGTEAELSRTLIKMEYIDVSIESCLLMFSRLNQPSTANNSLYKYTRIIHLDTLDLSSPPKAIKLVNGGNTIYHQEYPHLDSYFWIFSESLSFDTLSKQIYPASHWPYYDVSTQDIWTPIVESLLQQKIADLAKMNLWIDYTKWGRSTIIPRNFEMSYPDLDALTAFMAAVETYAEQTGCGKS